MQRLGYAFIGRIWSMPGRAQLIFLCLLGAGLGPRPSTDTGNDLIDSIVWVKPPGESDGTSDTSSTRYDSRE